MAGPGRPRKIRPEEGTEQTEQEAAPTAPRPEGTFPMFLFLDKESILVHDEEEEAIALEKGFKESP